MSDMDSIHDSIERASFLAGAAYRVKAIDDDAGGGGEGAFHQHLEQDEEELEEETPREGGHESPLEADSTGRAYEAAVPEDHVTLSDAVKDAVEDVDEAYNADDGEGGEGPADHLNIVA